MNFVAQHVILSLEGVGLVAETVELVRNMWRSSCGTHLDTTLKGFDPVIFMIQLLGKAKYFSSETFNLNV